MCDRQMCPDTVVLSNAHLDVVSKCVISNCVQMCDRQDNSVSITHLDVVMSIRHSIGNFDIRLLQIIRLFCKNVSLSLDIRHSLSAQVSVCLTVYLCLSKSLYISLHLCVSMSLSDSVSVSLHIRTTRYICISVSSRHSVSVS